MHSIFIEIDDEQSLHEGSWYSRTFTRKLGSGI